MKSAVSKSVPGRTGIGILFTVTDSCRWKIEILASVVYNRPIAHPPPIASSNHTAT